MAKFRGQTNLHLGHPVWAKAQYDDVAKCYVVEVDGKDADRFREVAEGYGFVEESAPVVEKPAAKPAPGKRARKVVESD